MINNYPNTIPEIRAIVCDLDGTLLNSEHQMSRCNDIVVRSAIKLGIPFIIATGKTRYAARDIIKKLQLETPGVFIQGLTVYSGKGVLIAETILEPELAKFVFQYGEHCQLIPIAYNADRILIRVENEEINQGFLQYKDPIPEVCPNIEEVIQSLPVHKVIYLGQPHEIQAARSQLSQRLNGKIQLTQAAIPEMLEILPYGASKGAGVKQALEYLNVDLQYVMAIGDGENDIEMLQMVGFSVAMENASEQVKAITNYMTHSNDQDGVAHAIERFVLMRESI